VRHVSQEIFDNPGALLKDIVVQPRVVTLSVSLYSRDRTREDLHRARASLIDALRWDRDDNEASVLRYSVGGNAYDLNVFYASDVVTQQGREGLNEIMGVRLVAYDPLWYDDTESSLTLDWSDELTTRAIAAKIDGLWDGLGPPAAVGGNQNPFDMALDPATGDVYIAGDFLNWDNVANADYLARWDVSTSTWGAVGDDGVGGPALNAFVNSVYFGPDGTLYVAGTFTNAGGVATADYVAQVDVVTDTWADVGGGPGAGAVTSVLDQVIGQDGTFYICGNFTNWDGLGSPAGDYIVQLAPGGVWATVGNGLNGVANCLAVLLNGNIICGGLFTLAGAVADTDRIAEWDGTVWTPLDTGIDNGTVYDVAVGPDGILYATGSFTTVSGETINRIASWNGAAWSDLDGGLDVQGERLAIADDGNLYVGGLITLVSNITVDSIARWNGYTWASVDFDGPGAPSGIYAIATDGVDLYLGFNAVGTSIVSGDNSVTNTGSALSYPTIEIKNAGRLQLIKNETTGDELLFYFLILDGEIVTIDMNPGLKTITSDWRGNVLGELLPNSDLGVFKLESFPRANQGDTEGANLISVFITDAAPRESGDDNNQLSDWADITGIAQSNTDFGWIYVSIVADGGGFFHVDLYKDSGKAAADLVGHTGTYNGAGAEAIIADNTSGLGGTITVDAVVGADTDIEVIFTIVTIFYFNRWWSADEAVTE
jgi:hypothetical protein